MSLRLIRDAAIDFSLSPHLYSFFFYPSFFLLPSHHEDFVSRAEKMWGGGVCNLSHSLANLLSAITPTNQVEVFEGLSFFFAPIRWKKKKNLNLIEWSIMNTKTADAIVSG